MKDARPPVVFLHGLGRSKLSMLALRRHVERAGFRTWSRTYPSRKMTVVEAAKAIAEWIREDLGDVPVLGVTHSLGGILARHMRDLLTWRGLVMLAPPNRGSAVAARFQGSPLFRWFTGPAGIEMAVPRGWPPPPEPFAVIAGSCALSLVNPTSWLTRSLTVFGPDQPNDGTIAVAETRLPRMAAFATVEASHTWIMNDARTREMVLSFLTRGRF